MCTEDMKELLDRTRRLESRMVQLGDHVGANLRSKQKIEILPAKGTGLHVGIPAVAIDSLDVSVSRILTELRQHNVRANAVEVFHEGRIAFTLYPNQPRTQ